MNQRVASLLLALPAFLYAGPVRAQAAASGTAHVMTDQLGPLTRAQPRGTLEPVTVHFRDGAVRMEFTDRGGVPYALVVPAGASTGWLLDGKGGGVPVPQLRWPLQFDPAAPCSGQGMFADCQRVEQGTYAGRNAVRWRYRLSNATGPGQTRQGSMWLDAETGLVLAYEGKTGLGQDRRWQVRQIRYRPLPDALFEVPSVQAARAAR